MGKISLGCRVSARIGPLIASGEASIEVSMENGAKRMKRMRAKRTIFHGTVVQSCPEGKWRVHWDECGKLSDHQCSHLKFLCSPPEDFDFGYLISGRQMKDLSKYCYIGDHAAMLAWTSKGMKEKPRTNNEEEGSPNITTARITNNDNNTAQPQRNPPTAPNNVPPAPNAPPQRNPSTLPNVLPQQRRRNPSTVPNNTPPAPNAPLQRVPNNNPPAPHAPPAQRRNPSTVLPPNNTPPAPNGLLAETQTNAPAEHQENVSLHEEGDPDNDMDEELIDERVIEAELRNEQYANRHTILLTLYKRQKESLLGREVNVKGPGQLNTTWTVVPDIKAEDVQPLKEFERDIGIRGFEFGPSGRTVRDKRGKNSRINFMDLFRHLWPGDENDQLKKINEKLKLECIQRETGSRQVKYKPITLREYYTFFGLLIANRTISDKQGEVMWSTKVEEETRLRSTVTAFDPTKYMSLKRFHQIKRVFPFIFADEDRKQNDDPWWQIASAFHQFNENRQLTLAGSNISPMDESMSAFRPRTTATGNLPHLSFVLRKPENLGTEIKNSVCGKTQIMRYISLCRKKTDKSEPNEFTYITDKKTAQVSLKIMKGCMHNRIEQLENEEHIDTINSSSTPEVFLGDAWFASVDLAYHSKRQLNVEFIGVIETNSGRYPKQFLENTMKDWPGGSHLVLKTTVDGIDLFAIGYKYCKSKTLMFIMTDGVGHTEPGEPYLAKWIDNNLNQMHRRIPRPAAVSFYFNHSNVVDIHNQQRQKELRLEKCWVTQDGYFRIITTLIGITVVDAWRGYTFHSKEKPPTSQKLSC
jgi:hypothetical protein